MPLNPFRSNPLMSLGCRDHETIDLFTSLPPSGSGPRILTFRAGSIVTALTVTLEAPELDEDSAKADEVEDSLGIIVEVDEDVVDTPLPEIEYEETDENVDEGATNPWGEPMRPVRRGCADPSFTYNPPASSPPSVSAYSLSESMVGEETSITITGLIPCLRSSGQPELVNGEDRYGNTGVGSGLGVGARYDSMGLGFDDRFSWARPPGEARPP